MKREGVIQNLKRERRIDIRVVKLRVFISTRILGSYPQYKHQNARYLVVCL